jgi:hypothetical protein
MGDLAHNCLMNCCNPSRCHLDAAQRGKSPDNWRNYVLDTVPIGRDSRAGPLRVNLRHCPEHRNGRYLRAQQTAREADIADRGRGRHG